MSRTIKSELDSHRGELKFRAHRGKHSKGRKIRTEICTWCLRNINKLERDRKTILKYPKQNINGELND